MNPDFKHIMSKRTDEELINIVFFDRDGYQPKGVEAAEEEIKIRNISEETIALIKAGLTQKIEKQQAFNSKAVSLTTRFIHSVVDTFFAFLIYGILTYTFTTFYVKYALFESEYIYAIYVGLIFLVSFFGYYVYMETRYQKTIGKFITKTKVVNLDGTKPTLGTIVSRTLCRLIPFDRLSFLFATAGFHDKFSNTTVIKDASNSIEQ